MNLHIAKFGGTSMGTLEAMQKSAEIILRDPEARLIVVSATSGTTNQLIQLYEDVLENGFAAAAEASWNAIAEKHLAIGRRLDLPTAELEKISGLLAELSTLLRNLSGRSDSILDGVLSFGERLSSLLFAQTLRRAGARARVFDVRRVLRTDGNFGKAEPEIQDIDRLARTELSPELATGEIIVTQGFIGATAGGETTTLGRGGSDYSAALLAEGLGAEELQIWTDVSGIMTMDPRIVPHAAPIERISFAEATELANFGAKVLHPATLWPAIRKNIRVYVGNTFAPETLGTWIFPELPEKPAIRAIALREKQTLITVTSLRMLHAHGFLAKIFGILAEHKISVDLVTTSEVSVALTIDGTNLASSGQSILANTAMLSDLRRCADVRVEENLSLVALIGNQLTHTPGISARAFQAVQEENVRLICHGASANNLCFLVSSDSARAVVQNLHKEFIR